MKFREIREIVDEIKDYAHKEWESSQDIIRLNEEVYQNFLLTFRSAIYTSQDSLFLSSSDKNYDNQIALRIYFGVVNYCFVNPFTKQDYLYKLNGRLLTRSTGFYTALDFSKINWNSPENILDLSISNWFELLQTNDENDLYDIENRFFKLKKFANYLLTRNILNLAEFVRSQKTASNLLKLLIDSDLFEDNFLKRAQVTISSVFELIKSKHDLSSFRDIDDLTLMADYRIPQLFYNSGLIQILDENLLTTLKNYSLIASGSKYETALRSSVIVVGANLARDVKLSERVVDKTLWEMSQKWIKEGKMLIPSMLVATDKY